MELPSVKRLREIYPNTADFPPDFPPNSHLTTLEVQVDPTVIRCQFHLNQVNFQMDYFKNPTGCIISWYKDDVRHQKHLEDMDFVDAAFEDIGSLLKDKKEVLEVLSLDFQFNFPSENDEDLVQLGSKCHENLITLLEDSKIQVQNFQIAITHPYQALPILQYLDQNILKKMKIKSVKGLMKRGNIDTLDMKEMIKMELWRKIEELNVKNLWISNAEIGDFVHLKKANLAFKNVSIDMVIDLKKAFRTTKHMEKFEIHYELSDSKDQFIQLFGAPFEEKNTFGLIKWKWFFKIPTNNQQVSIICFVRNSIIFEFMDLKHVPKRAKVKED